MTDEIKKQQQMEWTKTVTLAPDQVQHIIASKIARGRIYSAQVRHKHGKSAAICKNCQTEIV